MKLKSAPLIACGIAALLGLGIWMGSQWAASPAVPAVKEGISAASVHTSVSGHPLSQGNAVTRNAEGHVMEASRRLLPTPVWVAPLVPEDLPSTPKAERTVMATAFLEPAAFADLNSIKQGDRIMLPLGGDESVEGLVNLVRTEDDHRTLIGGDLLYGRKGNFSLSQSANGDRAGHIVVEDKKVGYELSTKDGRIVLNKKPIESLLCYGIPKAPGPKAARAPGGPQAIGAIPNLESLPSASGVIYLDFDGEVSTDPLWNGGKTITALPAEMNGSPITTAQMTDVWKRVSEDFKPFKVNVTTMLTKYNSALPGQRMHVIITPTNTAAPTAGGVAYLGSYRGPARGFSATIPCWAFNDNNPAIMAMTISHETGHTFDLSHDGDTKNEYYGGHGSGLLSWGPIMGAPFGSNVVQWSKGEYTGANNHEDDFAIGSNLVGEPLGGQPAFVVDEAGDTMLTANTTTLPLNGVVNATGLILAKKSTITTSSNEVDYYLFRTKGGAATFTVTPATPEPNFDATAEIHDSVDAVVATAPISTVNMAATVTATLPNGTFYLVVKGKGRSAIPGNEGYTTYGSAGEYALTGSWVPLPTVPFFTLDPVSQTATQGTKVTFTAAAISNVAIAYQWRKNGVIMPGKTSSSLVFASVQPTDAATYTVDAKNASGTTPSMPAVLTVNYKPIFTQQPTPAAPTNPVGSSVTFTVATSALPLPVTYQWQKNGVNIANETNASLTLTNLDWFSAGKYTVVATNSIGSTTSLAGVLTINSAPFLTTDLPLAKPIAINSTVAVSVVALGSPTLTYQWYRGTSAGARTPIVGATKATYTFSKAQVAANGPYHVVVTNSVGTATSHDMVVDVQNPPVVTTQPTAVVQTLNKDATLNLSVVASGTPTLTYQWQLNNVNIPGATSAAYSTVVDWFSHGVYRCLVTNAVGTAISKTSTLTVNSPAVIVTPPSDLKIARNGTGVLKVVGGGTGLLKYQWYKDTVLLPGKTAATLVLTKVQPATTDGFYTVTVSNVYNSVPATVTSSAAHVTVEDVPVITTHPLTQPVAFGGSITLSVVHSGTGPFQYQWQKNNVNMLGEINPTLILSNAQATTAATYRVIVKNAVGTATSFGAKISVLTKPTITVDPISQSRFEHDTISLTVVATGSPTLTYQWRKDGINLSTPVSAKAATLVLTDTPLTAAGGYDCVVTNSVGSATSAVATLTMSVVPLPQYSYFAPTKGVPGERVEIQGTNLTWTRHVLFNGKEAAFLVKSNSELRVTVPTGATTGVITVQTYGGTITTAALPTPSFTVTSVAPNDNFIDAKILEGSSVLATGSTVAASQQSFDYPTTGNQGHSVWFRWRAPASGIWQFDTIGSSFDTVLVLFKSPLPPYPLPTLLPEPVYSDLTPQTLNYEYALNGHTARIKKTGALRNEEYWIMLDGDGSPTAPFWKDKGAYQFRITYFGVGGALEPDAPASGKVTSAEPDVVAASSVASSSGAAADSVSLQPLEPSPAAAAIVAGTQFTINPGENSDEQYTWSVYNKAGDPALALVFDAKTKAISIAKADGTSEATGQVFAAGEPYHLELQLDYARSMWSALLNGVWIAENKTLPAGAFGDLSGAWHSTAGEGTGGLMEFKNAWSSPVPAEAK